MPVDRNVLLNYYFVKGKDGVASAKMANPPSARLCRADCRVTIRLFIVP